MNFMKRAGFVLTCATMLANLCAAQNTERTPQGMKCTTQGMDIRVEFYSPSIVRVYKTPEGKNTVNISNKISKTAAEAQTSCGGCL